MTDNILVYVLPGLVSAYNVMIIRANYQGIPHELIEAARIDGASEWYTCFKIVIPLAKPGIASVAFLFMVQKWNDWQTSMLYIRNPDLYSLQYLLQRITSTIQKADMLVIDTSIASRRSLHMPLDLASPIRLLKLQLSELKQPEIV